MAQPRSQMALDIAEIPAVAERQIIEGLELYLKEGARIAELAPPVIVTCARGTSDCAAMYFKYLVESGLGVPVASIGPSIASVYGASLRLSRCICLTVSQSGASPDLVSLQASAVAGGAESIAVVNERDSPVEKGAGTVLPIFAGRENAVAATKTFVASLIALCAIYAGMSRNRELVGALRRLPETLARALECDWHAAIDRVLGSDTLFVISRGPGLAIAEEAALKFKEVCRTHAEALSAAEILHGPVALTSDRMSVLAFVPDDLGREAVLDSVRILENGGATVTCVGEVPRKMRVLPAGKSPHPALTPVCQIASFYRFVESLAYVTGADPDTPPRLKKVTKTI